MLNDEIKQTLTDSVICWLATADEFGCPNVSPKEIFIPYQNSHILIANIASPTSVSNISSHPSVCISCIHIFKQKGFKFKGVAKNLCANDKTYAEKHALLFALAGTRFPIKSIIEVEIKQIHPILAPSYILYPDTSEATQIKNAMATYGVKPIS